MAHLGNEAYSERRAWALALVAAARFDDDGDSVVDRLTQICRASTRGVAMSGAAVLVRATTEAEAVIALSDADWRPAADLGIDHGEGPTVDAFTLGRPVLASHLADGVDVRWPGYMRSAAPLGVHGVFAFPLQVGASRFGVLALFSSEIRHLDHDDLAACLVMVDLATEVLLDSTLTEDDGGLDPDLQSALELRGEIYQAQGMVMVALGVALPDALARMRAHAFVHSRDLASVAVDIVAGRLDLARG